MDVWLAETYFDWLWSDCFSARNERKEYEGVLRALHEIPFYWTIWLDENRAGDALSYRQSDFLAFQKDLDHIDQHWLVAWANAAPSVLEVLLGIARRWNYFFGADVCYYFGEHLFKNMEFHRFPGRVLSGMSREDVRQRVDTWLSRQFLPNGYGSPFPVTHALDVIDMRQLDIWSQMNAYSAEHFQ